MNIRTRLTLRFLLLVSLVFIGASIFIYGFMADYRKDSFYTRLLNKANGTAKLLIEVDEIDASLLRKIERDNPTSLPNEKITVYDHENNQVFSTDERNILTPDAGILETIRQKGEIRYTMGEYEVAGASFKMGDETYVVIAGAVDIFGKKRMQYLHTTLLIVNAMTFVMFFIAGWVFSGQALAPIQSVINQVDKITLNKLNLRVDEGNGTDEIARLAKTFNRMLERLELAFKIEKNFIANASHELRTPLTSITGQLEVDLLKERSREEYKATLQSVLEEMKDLNEISDRLLLLAQTSSERGKLNFAPVRIDEVIWQCKSELKKIHPDYKIHVKLNDDLEDDNKLTVNGNEYLLRTALTNLADNGCKYSDTHEVVINIHSNGNGKVVVEFHDKGIGISAGDLNQIFEPFYRGKNALKYKGHGIGLSLVKRTVILHNGEVNVTSSETQGTTFTVSLPALS